MTTESQEPCEVLNKCPLCGGPLAPAVHTRLQYVCECGDCKTQVTVPASAWAIWRTKRSAPEESA